MGIFERVMGRRRPVRVVLYHSPTWQDCQKAKRFFARHQIEYEEYDVKNDEAARERMNREFGRVATPAIVIDRHVFWGFEENMNDIADLLGLSVNAADAALANEE